MVCRDLKNLRCISVLMQRQSVVIAATCVFSGSVNFREAVKGRRKEWWIMGQAFITIYSDGA